MKLLITVLISSFLIIGFQTKTFASEPILALNQVKKVTQSVNTPQSNTVAVTTTTNTNVTSDLVLKKSFLKTIGSHRKLLGKVKNLTDKLKKDHKDVKDLQSLYDGTLFRLNKLEMQLQNKTFNKQIIKVAIIDIQKQIKLMQVELRTLAD